MTRKFQGCDKITSEAASRQTDSGDDGERGDRQWEAAAHSHISWGASRSTVRWMDRLEVGDVTDIINTLELADPFAGNPIIPRINFH